MPVSGQLAVPPEPQPLVCIVCVWIFKESSQQFPQHFYHSYSHMASFLKLEHLYNMYRK